VVRHQFAEPLVLARRFGGAPRIRVERRLRHLRAEFLEAATKRGDVRQLIHAWVVGLFANCAGEAITVLFPGIRRGATTA